MNRGLSFSSAIEGTTVNHDHNANSLPEWYCYGQHSFISLHTVRLRVSAPFFFFCFWFVSIPRVWRGLEVVSDHEQTSHFDTHSGKIKFRQFQLGSTWKLLYDRNKRKERFRISQGERTSGFRKRKVIGRTLSYDYVFFSGTPPKKTQNGWRI